jgi:hypothetical protein
MLPFGDFFIERRWPAAGQPNAFSFSRPFVPEIRAMILEKLNGQDLKNYSLACHAFDADAAPFLWQSFVLEFGYDFAALDAARIPILRIPERAKYVRTLTISPTCLNISFSGDLPALKESFTLLRNVRDLRLLFRELRLGVTPKVSSSLMNILVTQIIEWMKNVALVSFTCDGIRPGDVLSLLRASPSLSNVTVNDSYYQIVAPTSPDDISALPQASLPYLSMLSTSVDWVPILSGGRDLDTLSLSPGRQSLNWLGTPGDLRKSCTVHNLDLSEIPSEQLPSALQYIRGHIKYPATTVKCSIYIPDAVDPGHPAFISVFWVVKMWGLDPQTLFLRCVWSSEQFLSFWTPCSIIHVLDLFPPSLLSSLSSVFIQFSVRKSEGTKIQEMSSITFKRREDGSWAALSPLSV